MKRKDFIIICILYTLVGVASLILLFMFLWILKITIDEGDMMRIVFVSCTIFCWIFVLISFTIRIIKLFKRLRIKEIK